MSTHKDHKFSITVHTDDLAILYCLRALADYSQETGNTRITWGGTKKVDWEKNGNSVAFRFTRSEYRSNFKSEANRVLPANSWNIKKEADNDPAVKR